MPRKKNLTAEQIKMIEAMCQYRMPMEQIANIVGVSKDTLEKWARRNKELRAAIKNGRSRGSSKAYMTAYNVAFGHRTTKQVAEETEVWSDKLGKYIKKVVEKTVTVDVPPNPQMMMFWLKTQEKWREVDRLELTGADGKPLTPKELPREVRVAKLEKYMALYASLQLARERMAQVIPAESTRVEDPALPASEEPEHE